MKAELEFPVHVVSGCPVCTRQLTASRGNNIYNNVFASLHAGIILVHDLTNRKSQQNLHRWLAEILNRDELSTGSE